MGYLPASRTPHTNVKKLYWIDDSHDEQKLPTGATKRRIESSLNVTLFPDKPLATRNDFVSLLAGMDHDHTRGVIMDYHLNNLGDRNNMAYGTTWAAEVRAAQPSIPVIGISHCDEQGIPKFRLQNFLAFFPRKELTGLNPEIGNLKALLTGYEETYRVFQTRGNRSGVSLVLELLSPPDASIGLLQGAIPPIFRGNWDLETPHAVGRWIWHELQGRPGFLFDQLELATHLGLNVSGLTRITARFDLARYQGCFASDCRPRWWVSSIRPIVETIIGGPMIGSISSKRVDFLKALRIKQGERAGYLARAYPRKSLDSVPDCVAFKDESREKAHRVQALFQETIVDEKDANPPFGFDARRVFGGIRK